MVTWFSIILFSCTSTKEPTNLIYFDEDGDGVKSDDDCNDSDPLIFPGADEKCDDVDNDCDGDVDEDAVDPSTWYQDSDGDGFGNVLVYEQKCDAPVGFIENGDDCDDSDVLVYPGSSSDGELCVMDTDGDGYGDSNAPSPYDQGSDCNDSDPNVHPGILEVCDTIDNDCDGLVDSEDDAIDPDHLNTILLYADEDGDGYGDENSTSLGCELTMNRTDEFGDCNDSSAESYPGAPEICDELDNDCNSLIDNFDDPSLECETCIDAYLSEVFGEVYAESTLVGDELSSTCSVSTEDISFRWVAPYSGEYTFSTSGDAVSVWSDCDTELACSLSLLEMTVEQGVNYNIVIEGSEANLTIASAVELACNDDNDDDQDGYFDCDDSDCFFDYNCALEHFGNQICPNFELWEQYPTLPTDGEKVLETTMFTSGDDEDASCFASGGQDLSYLYEATQDGCLEVHVYSNTVDVRLAQFDGCFSATTTANELQCAGGGEVNCLNGIDDDGDGKTDSYDPNSPLTFDDDCWTSLLFGPPVGVNGFGLDFFDGSYGAYLKFSVDSGQSYNLVVDGVTSSLSDTFAMAVMLTPAYCTIGNSSDKTSCEGAGGSWIDYCP